MVKSGKAIYSKLNYIYYSEILSILVILSHPTYNFSQSSIALSLSCSLCSDRACALLCDPNTPLSQSSHCTFSILLFMFI